MMQPANRLAYSGWITAGLFVVATAMVGGTVAGPGLSWDEPAYRGSQILLQEWCKELHRTGDAALFSKEQIDHYWEFNRFGPNFHPPMASYLNLAAYGLVGGFWDDISARRLASALEFAAVVALLGHFLGVRYGWPTGVFAGLSLLTMPRLVGDAHVIGTDVPLLFLDLTTLRSGTDSIRRWQFVCIDRHLPVSREIQRRSSPSRSGLFLAIPVAAADSSGDGVDGTIVSPMVLLASRCVRRLGR